MLAAKRAHFDQIDRLADIWGGHRVAPPAGDSCLALFADSLAATQFACEARKRPGHAAIKVKAGVHRGRVHFVLDQLHGIQNVYGLNVDFAKRLQEALTEPGVMLSDRIKDEIEAILGADQRSVRLQPVDAALKGFGTRQIWRIVTLTRGFLRFR